VVFSFCSRLWLMVKFWKKLKSLFSPLVVSLNLRRCFGE
jgi:hypothetical protein